MGPPPWHARGPLKASWPSAQRRQALLPCSLRASAHPWGPPPDLLPQALASLSLLHPEHRVREQGRGAWGGEPRAGCRRQAAQPHHTPAGSPGHAGEAQASGAGLTYSSSVDPASVLDVLGRWRPGRTSLWPAAPGRAELTRASQGQGRDRGAARDSGAPRKTRCSPRRRHCGTAHGNTHPGVVALFKVRAEQALGSQSHRGKKQGHVHPAAGLHTRCSSAGVGCPPSVLGPAVKTLGGPTTPQPHVAATPSRWGMV